MDVDAAPARTRRWPPGVPTRHHLPMPLPIVTERLTLRAYRPSDLADLHNVLYSNEQAMAWPSSQISLKVGYSSRAMLTSKVGDEQTLRWTAPKL